MVMFMEKYLAFSYWFAPLPGSVNLPFWRIIFALAGACVVFGVVSLFMARRFRSDGVRRRPWRKFTGWGLTTGIVTFIIGFFRFQNAYLLSMRFFIIAWGVCMLIWLALIVRFRFVRTPRRLAERDAQAAFAKYLPHKSK